MKKILFLGLFLSVFFISAQDNKKGYLQVNYFYGNILKHNKNVGHFLENHPTGIIASYNIKTLGNKEWQHRYNYPDFGISTSYQDYKNTILGKMYALYGHFNFYLLPRKNKNQIVLRTGWGIAYNTNPYNKETNPRNVAFGSKLNSSTYFNLYYKRVHVFKKFGVNAGVTLIHASNSSVKSPNTGVNVWAATVGVNYDLNTNKLDLITSNESKKYTEPIKYNFVFRFGANETDFIGSGVKPFFVISAYADKRINRKSSLQFGSEFLVNYSLKDYIEISAITSNTPANTDFKRVGLFLGHELFINKISMIAQFGYYVYYPFEFEGRIYERIGLKYYFKKKYFASVSLKAHAAKAETVAFGIGIRI